MTDLESNEMQDEINKEAGSDSEDGGIDLDDTDGITRNPEDDEKGSK